ncbi:MAG: hypothetical protein WDW38_007810 [Sanguina aurantia]
MENYEKGVVIGYGTYGSVHRATHRLSGQAVAIKKVRVGDAQEGVALSALREVGLLRELSHPHIVTLLDVFPHKANIKLVFELLDMDLEVLIRDSRGPLPAAHVKGIMHMLLQALSYTHSHGIVHRDVKPNNLLLASDGTLKLADFGLARLLHRATPDAKFTNQVCSRWYRSPELLYGSTSYGPAVDMWGAGCVLGELLLKKVWFKGGSDVDQLERIFSALGSPTPQQAAALSVLPNYLPWADIPPTPPQASGVSPLARLAW